MNNSINVILVSPQMMFLKGLEITLSSEPDIKVIESFYFSNDIEFKVENLPSDIVIFDIDGRGNDGFDIAHRLKQRLSNIATIIFTSHPDDEHLFLALKAQVSACLGKEVKTEEIIDTIRRSAAGEYPINEVLYTRPKLTEQIIEKFQELAYQSDTKELVSPLTTREAEILRYISKGFLNKQIAFELKIGEQTIKNHVTSILRKLNANVRTEAVVIGIKRGIISLN